MRLSILSILGAIVSLSIIVMTALFILNIIPITGIPEYLEFLNLPSLGIVLGGLLLVIVISYPPSEIKAALLVAQHLLSHSKINSKTFKADIQQVLEWQSTLRKNKLKAREELNEKLENTFEGYVFMLMSTNYKNEEIRELAHNRISEQYNRNMTVSRIYQMLGNTSPALGMLGTLLGLIHMLGNFQDVDELGRGLGFALMTTLYGLSLSHLIFMPLMHKTRLAAEKQYFRDSCILEGILMINEGKPPIMVYDKLSAFQKDLTTSELPLLDTSTG